MQQSTQKCKSKRIYKCCFSSKTAFYSNSTTYVHLSHSLSIYFSFTLHHYLIFFCSSLSFSVLFYFFYSEPSFSFFHSFSLQTYSLLLYVSILVLNATSISTNTGLLPLGLGGLLGVFKGALLGTLAVAALSGK